MDLTKQKCVPCEGGVEPFTSKEVSAYMTYLTEPWDLVEDKKIQHKYEFNDFLEAMDFVNKVADIANKDDHHPDIYISYSRVTVTLWTHSINGLSPNDFIVASKIEQLLLQNK